MISRADAFYCVGRYLKYVPKEVRKDIIKDMEREKLLEWVNRETFKILNEEASECMIEFCKVEDIWGFNKMGGEL